MQSVSLFSTRVPVAEKVILEAMGERRRFLRNHEGASGDLVSAVVGEIEQLARALAAIRTVAER